jgi:hypothetical protein
MKILIDETLINTVVRENKLEVAEWLLTYCCPVNSSVYLQNFSIPVLDWLDSKKIEIDKKCMPNILNSTSNIEVINWFIDKDVELNYDCISTLIKNNNLDMIKLLCEKYSVSLHDKNYIVACLQENIEILDYLKSKGCPYSQNVLETCLKQSKKHAIKWLVMNNFF